MSSKKFIDEVRSLMKGYEVNSELIWKSLDGSQSLENVSYLCDQMLDSVITSEKKQIAHENEERTLATLVVLQFYKNKKKKNPKTIEQHQKQLRLRKDKISGHGDFVVSMLLEDNFSFPQALISRYAFGPRSIDQTMDPGQQILDKLDECLLYFKQLQMQNPQKFYNCLRKISYDEVGMDETRILSFSYVCLGDHFRIQNNKVTLGIYSHIYHLLWAHMHALRQSNRTKPYAIFLLNLLQNLLTFYGCQFPQIMKSIMTILIELKCYPEAIGQLSTQTFDMLYKEIKSPGTSFRNKLRSDFPSLDNSRNASLNKECFLITSKEDVFSCPQHCSLTTLRKLFIFQVVRMCRFQNEKPFVQLLRRVNGEMTFEIYFKILKILQITNNFEVFDKIRKMQRDAVKTLFTYTDDQLTKKQEIELNVEEEESSQFDHLINKENRIGIFDYPSYEIVHVPIQRFITPKNEYNFLKMISKVSKTKLLFYKNRLPLVFLTNDQEFNSSIQGICEFMEKADIEDYRCLRIYIISNSNSLADYIASKDIKYRRFIHHSFKKSVIFPETNLDLKSKELFPTYLYNKLIHTYLREGQRTIPIKVYKCQIVMKETPKPVNMYFYSHILIGTSADAEILRNNKLQEKEKVVKYSQISYIQLLTDKLKKINSSLLNVQLIEVNELTGTKEKKSEKGLKVQDITICNLPRDYFFGNKPDPSAACFEVSILTEPNGKIFRKQILNKDNFKNIHDNDLNDTVEGFRDLFIASSALGVKIENAQSNKETFKAVVDGHTFMKVERLVVDTVQNTNGIPLSLPVQCFLPYV